MRARKEGPLEQRFALRVTPAFVSLKKLTFANERRRLFRRHLR